MGQSDIPMHKAPQRGSVIMPALVILGLLQTAILLFLLARVVALDSQAGLQTEAAGQGATEQLRATSSPSSRPAHGVGQLDENRLRHIIRQELSAQLTANSAISKSGEEDLPRPVSEAEYQYRLEAALQDLDFYIREGEISDADMARLQGDIAGLDDEGRKQMLSLITQALNSGELKGNF
jgi:hypothetical protein